MLKRFEIALLIGLIVGIMISSLSAFASESAQIRSQVLRLHVIANSDNEEDVDLKFAVRDAVLESRAELFASAGDIEEIRELAAQSLDIIEAAARDEISRRGYSYTVRAELVNMYFATRQYEGFIMPAGRYDAVRLIIGDGGGENWWCVMFPPMCLPAAGQGSGASLQERINALGQTPQYVPKFAIVELIEGLFRN